ncbi:MAG: hypothetical protein K8L99_15680 [Anaerolineae bacterium]|nr:hypothetical protein [Anaerolineae bacterium]
MMTWKLWRALHTPPANHPLFEHIASQPEWFPSRSLGLLWPVGLGVLTLTFLIGVWYVPQVVMPMLFHPHVALLIGLLLFTGTVYGFAWAISISSMINRMRGQGKYDLLRLSSLSTFGVNWTICTGYLYRQQLFKRISLQHTRATQLALTLTGALIMPILIGLVSSNQEFVLSLLITGLHIITIAAAFQIDHVQSVVMGSLIAMITPIYTRNITDTRIFAGVTFLSLQLTTYLISWFVGFELLPGSITALLMEREAVELVIPILRVIVFYLTREIVILTLWQVLSYHLQANRAELDLLAA